MAGGTSGIRQVAVSQDKSPGITPPSRSINPVGNRTLQPKVTRAPRNPRKKNTRDYGKNMVPEQGGFDLPGFGKAPFGE